MAETICVSGHWTKHSWWEFGGLTWVVVVVVLAILFSIAAGNADHFLDGRPKPS